MLELRDICFERDGKKILDNVSLKLEDDKFIVITGPNGSGKSNLALAVFDIILHLTQKAKNPHQAQRK